MSDREESPDWLRSFQAPAQITLSSSDDEDSINLSKLFQKDKTSLSEARDGHESQLTKTSEVNSPIKNEKVDRTPTRKRKKENQSEREGKGIDKASTKRRALEKPSTDKLKRDNRSLLLCIFWPLSLALYQSYFGDGAVNDCSIDKLQCTVIKEAVPYMPLERSYLWHELMTAMHHMCARSRRHPSFKRIRGNQAQENSEFNSQSVNYLIMFLVPRHSVCTLSSDSESSHDGSPIKVEEVLDKELLMHDAKATKKEENDVLSKQKSPKKKTKKEEQEKKVKLENQLNEEKEDMDAVEENIPEKQSGPNLSSSRLPLVLPEKVQRTKALVECEGDSVDLSGDVGAVGRIIISDGPSGNHEMLLDLKGTVYETTILPSRTFCVVSFGQSEAKVEAIMNDFIQLKSQSNIYDAETMVEGTLDGFTFDSDEEAENLPRQASQGDQNEDVDHQTNGNVKAKPKKASAMEQKKGKKGAKVPKKVKKNPNVQKKRKSKK